MNNLIAPQSYELARSEVRTFTVDWGENSAGTETGELKAGDTVASGTVAVESKPSGASDPTLGSVSVNATAVFVNGRSCSAGEATTFQVTLGSSQTYGRYVLKCTATTTNGFTIPRYVAFACVQVQ